MSLLRVERLSRTFGSLAAVHEVSFGVARGEHLAIIGPNGAGKTTLFNLITGKLPPSGGRVWFAGEDLTGLAPHQVAQRGLARSFQLTNLFPELSAYDNVWLAAQARHPRRRSLWRAARDLVALDERVRRVLEQVGLADQAHRPAAELSYGDQRHLEIGLALATEPQLLLLDEPTSGISPAETQRTIRLIQRLARDLTLLLIEHDMDVVLSVCERLLVMHYGQVLAEGLPEQVERDPAVQEAYLGDFD